MEFPFSDITDRQFSELCVIYQRPRNLNAEIVLVNAVNNAHLHTGGGGTIISRFLNSKSCYCIDTEMRCGAKCKDIDFHRFPSSFSLNKGTVINVDALVNKYPMIYASDIIIWSDDACTFVSYESKDGLDEVYDLMTKEPAYSYLCKKLPKELILLIIKY